MISNILSICYYELKQEFRQKYAVAGILLFLIGSVFVVFKIFQSITPFSWNALYWILFLFVSTNALLKSFSQVNRKRFMFFYQLYSPIELAISKMIYNTFLLFVIGVLLFVFLSGISINPIEKMPIFFTALFLACLGVGASLSFVSLIANKGTQNHILISILSMPILIPIILLLTKITAVSMGILDDTSIAQDFLLLGAIDLFSIGLCLILFPYLWRL